MTNRLYSSLDDKRGADQPVYSSCHGRQLEERILAQWGDGLQGHIAGALHGPFIVLLEQDGADQTGDGILVGEDVLDRQVELGSWLWLPQNSVPRSVSTRHSRMLCSS